jgi:hypothetical protein
MEADSVRASAEGLKGDQGQKAVGGQFLALRWGVAENPQPHDLGTDLWLMARDTRRFDLGALLGAQVKYGSSWFDSPEHDEAGEVIGWWHPDSQDHFKYWAEHRVPHILVLHCPQTSVSYWVHVTPDAVVHTGKRAKILVPRDQTIDDEHLDALVEVATSDLGHPGWEGSSWNRRAIARHDRLRFALLTPRLIAPHPNLLVEQYTADEAIAVLIEMRLGGLMPSPFPWHSTKTPDLAQCRTSDDWWWRFYAALYDVLVDNKDFGVIRALIAAENVEPFEAAAAAATTAALLVQRGLPGEALDVVTPLIESDKCEPVDHNWMLMHKARCLADLGDLQAAQALAIEIQALRPLTRTDPTAGSLVGSSAGLIIATNWSHPQSLTDVLGSRDTLAAWWRTEEVASGLQHEVDEAFRNWVHDTTITIGGADQTWLHLQTATLIAGLTGDHWAWRGIYAQLARRVLMTAADPAEAGSALTAMRAAGDEDSIKLAVAHLLRVGPAAAVSAAAHGIDLDASTRTTLLADIEFITASADVLIEEDLAAHTGWALRALADPMELHQRLQPTFVIPIYVLRMLAALVSVLPHAGLREVIEHLTGLAPQTDGAAATGYADVITNIPRTAWTAEDLEKLKSRTGDDFALAQAITGVLGRTDPETRASLLTSIAAGDVAALAAHGDLADLPEDTVAALVASLRAKIGEQIVGLNNGGSPSPPANFAGALALINVEHPGHADWQPVLDLLGTPTAFTEALDRPLLTLRGLRTRVPDAAAQQLHPLLQALTTATYHESFPGQPDVRGPAAAALAAILPDAVSDDDLWILMSGDAKRRVAAAQIIAGRERPEQLDALAALAFDHDPQVRAQATGGLAYWVTQDVATDRVLGLMRRILDNPGTDAARITAKVLDGKKTSPSIAQLAEMLREHPSAYVRSVSVQHTTTT